MKYYLFGILISLFTPQFTLAEVASFHSDVMSSTEITTQNKDSILDSITKKEFRKMKITAVALAVTLGVFGVHRLYLGTTARIPITYTLTLGGGFFVLPAIDIVYIIAAKSPEQLKNNSSIFMWNKKRQP